MTASRTTPTLWVLVIMTGPYSRPDSLTHVVPVISPLPFWLNQPANLLMKLALRAAAQKSRDHTVFCSFVRAAKLVRNTENPSLGWLRNEPLSLSVFAAGERGRARVQFATLLFVLIDVSYAVGCTCIIPLRCDAESRDVRVQ